MPQEKIPVAAIERSRTWITAVTQSLKARGNTALSRMVMKDCGKACAAQLLEKTIEHFGRTPKSVEELVEAINKRRKKVLNAATFWEFKDGTAHFKLEKCSCDMVEAGLAEPNPTFCLCSAGMFENLFARFHPGTVRTELVKTIGRGDDCCRFIVHFQE